MKSTKCRIFSSRRIQALVAATAFLFIVAELATAQTETVLYSFTGQADGAFPAGNLVMDASGNLYGTTLNGGNTCDGLPFTCGTVFEVTPSGAETVLYAFNGGDADGEWPRGGLTRGLKGIFYGTTSAGGDLGYGTVFAVSPTGNETVLSSLTEVGDPYAAPILDRQDNLYGTTSANSTTQEPDPYGSVYELTATGEFKVLHAFKGPGVGDGYNPTAGLVRDSDGNLFGATTEGGSNEQFCQDGCGTIFKVAPGGTETVLYQFSGTLYGAPRLPQGTLFRDERGNFYGATLYGGPAEGGVIFEFSPAGKFRLVYRFKKKNDGANPTGSLISDGEGNLYGTTLAGGSKGFGTVFKVSLDGQETVLYSFTGGPSDGKTPNRGLIRDAAGNIYGTTYYGGASNSGTVFRVTP
jgi:uncharacterized repeat protein (TIGR03803 family)